MIEQWDATWQRFIIHVDVELEPLKLDEDMFLTPEEEEEEQWTSQKREAWGWEGEEGGRRKGGSKGEGRGKAWETWSESALT